MHVSQLALACLLALMAAACSAPPGGPLETPRPQPIEITASIAPGDGPTEVVFTLVNSGRSDTAVLRWGTPLEGIFTREFFRVTHGGRPVRYLGRTVKRASPDADQFLKLPAGGALAATLDLAAAYALPDAGQVTVELNLPVLTLLDDDGTTLYPLGPATGVEMNVQH